MIPAAVWLVLAFALALGLSLFVTPLVLRSADALRLYDSPDGDRRMHVLPVPRLGGVAVYLVAALVACVVLFRTLPHFIHSGPDGDAQIRILTGAFLGSALLFLVGLVDDLRGLSPGAKSVAQVMAAVIVWYFGLRLDTVALGYGQGVATGILGFPLLMLWIVGVTNALNFIDGLNGLAAGISVVACVAIVAVSALLGNAWVLIPAVVLAASLLGFLPYNFPKGRIFLGDAGSLSTGFLLAVLSIGGSVNRAGAVQVIVPILAMFVPLLDGMLAIVRRWLRNVPLSGADARHIHHRLLALGVSPQRTAVILWGLAAGMASFGLLMALTAPFVATSVAILGLVGVSVLVIYGTNLLSYHELVVAGEVLLNGPSRARVIISDQIKAMDLSTQIQSSETISDISEVLSDAAASFGFLGMELTGEDLTLDRIADHILSANWAWKLDYPIRMKDEGRTFSYVLSIWCSPEQSARPYGAERVARVLGPAITRWFESKKLESGVPAGQVALAASLHRRRLLRVR
jgi:UDP-GlcNAc:undecaprenyl-phosphate GlcNAc-1-phosphate transferase